MFLVKFFRGKSYWYRFKTRKDSILFSKLKLINKIKQYFVDINHLKLKKIIKENHN